MAPEIFRIMHIRMGHFAPRVAPKRANRKSPISIAKLTRNYENVGSPRKTKNIYISKLTG